MEGPDISGAFRFIAWVVVLLIATVLILTALHFMPDRIKSDKLLTPKIKLVVRKNVVDTIYIYER